MSPSPRRPASKTRPEPSGETNPTRKPDRKRTVDKPAQKPELTNKPQKQAVRELENDSKPSEDDTTKQKHAYVVELDWLDGRTAKAFVNAKDPETAKRQAETHVREQDPNARTEARSATRLSVADGVALVVRTG